ncbi:MAG: hypothetical protein KF799_11625 [Bdellovibrionales bacterium]|nr:hypothetical protein [Bdellovibrionales bacterium]
MAVKSLSFFMLVGLLGCAQGHCRHPATPPAEAKPLEATDVTQTPAVAGDRVFVYKYDGSLQCKMGKPVAVEVMAKELQGITIFSSVKKPDGLMHIQVCGSATGIANVYEIPSKDLKKAESKGFKKWSFE